MQNVFLIIDGNSIAYRGASVPPLLTNSKGRETGGTFRFVSMLNNAMKIVRATHVLVAWDVSRDNFRTGIDINYKANRESKSESLYSQFQDIKSILEAIGIKHVGVYGYEADDVIGTYVTNSKADKTFVFTGDRDSFQLINETTSILYPLTGATELKIFDNKTFKEEYEIEVNQFIDLKALMGDGSDNIKGVEKCGKKTAIKWLKQYGTIEKLIENAGDIGGKIGDNLRNWIPDSNKTIELVTIIRDVPVPFDYKECEIDLNWENVSEIFFELEFNSYIKRIKGGTFYNVFK